MESSLKLCKGMQNDMTPNTSIVYDNTGQNLVKNTLEDVENLIKWAF